MCGLRVWGLGFRVRVWGLRGRVWALGCASVDARGVRFFFRVGSTHPIAHLGSLVVPPQPHKLCSFRV